MTTAQITFAAQLSSVPAAQRYLREVLDDWYAASFEWAASQIVAGLATDAVIHAHTSFQLVLSLTSDGLMIGLNDNSPDHRFDAGTAPTRRPAAVPASSNRSTSS